MTAGDDIIARTLACTAITPALDSILVFDAPPARLLAIEAAFAAGLAEATGQLIHRFRIGSSATDDALWGSYRIEGRTVVWRPGPLASSTPTLAVVRDISTLGIETQRTLVALVNGDVAHLERHGQSKHWRPTTFWLAGCARRDIGKVSPHLLDRFVVRIDGAAPATQRTAESLANLVRLAEKHERLVDDEVEDAKLAGDHATVELRRRTVKVGSAAIERVLDYFSDDAPPRRSITLARLATGVAKLGRASEVTAAHVDQAAVLLRVELIAEPSVPPPVIAAQPPTPTASLQPGRPLVAGGTYVKPGPDPTIYPTEPSVVPAFAPDAAHIAVPFQEDRADVERDVSPLVFPAIQQRATVRALRGAAIGVVPTTEFRDLAITATIFEAAKHRRPDGKLEVTPADLRRYRRVAPVEHMLALVLDHTALAGWDWTSAVLPYLRDAYIRRAAICLVQVGTVEDPIRARHTVSRNVLAAPLTDVFAAKPGGATPLAHGLELAFEALRHALQHGRGVALEARLVVVTDGRGNVPLEASRRGEIVPPICDEGVRDAIEVSDKIRLLDRLESILIEPPPTVAGELPIRIAAALGAQRRSPRIEGVG